MLESPREMALRLANGDSIDSKYLTNLSLIEKNLKDIESNCREVLKQIKQFKQIRN
jgi:hypothetical protein